VAKRDRAGQLPPTALDVLPWQRDFWLLLIEHALAGRLGPPDLSVLEGFSAPAITQYTVTTPDLLRSFRKYNAGKPYHRQVRPFGFMVMFQEADDADASTMMRVIAPFNRNPTKAARKAFDRDTGATISPKQLKTYIDSLRTYYNHPESKFLNGERGDRGPTQRRHIIAKSIVHIGKEANKLDIQMAAGVDPDAQVEFHADASMPGRLKAVVDAIRRLGPSRIACEAGLSRTLLSTVANGTASPSEAALSKIERAILSLVVIEAKRAAEIAQVLKYLNTECKRVGPFQVANRLGISPSLLSRIISGQRSISAGLFRRICAAAALSK
jgi:transcriptional regulator with XRE-family HTH domain